MRGAEVTRADVDVQPYAFTTKSLFVGHMDHKYLRWQVIDTPGLLDRPLEERNTIEMQARARLGPAPRGQACLPCGRAAAACLFTCIILVPASWGTRHARAGAPERSPGGARRRAACARRASRRWRTCARRCCTSWTSASSAGSPSRSRRGPAVRRVQRARGAALLSFATHLSSCLRS